MNLFFKDFESLLAIVKGVSKKCDSVETVQLEKEVTAAMLKYCNAQVLHLPPPKFCVGDILVDGNHVFHLVDVAPVFGLDEGDIDGEVGWCYPYSYNSRTHFISSYVEKHSREATIADIESELYRLLKDAPVEFKIRPEVVGRERINGDFSTIEREWNVLIMYAKLIRRPKNERCALMKQERC